MGNSRQPRLEEADPGQLGRAWMEQAKGKDYLGEIVVGEDRMSALLKRLGRLPIDYVGHPDYAFALAVLAVNFAYYQGKDEAFRKPFLKEMGREEGTDYWDKELGLVIQRTIATWAGVPLRSGPFCHVGMVREHAGVPPAQMGRFVELLKRLRDDPGWESVGNAASHDLRAAVDACFGTGSKYAKEFLKSRQGIELIVSACRLMLLHVDGFLTKQQLRTARGFRADFFARLFEKNEDLLEDEPKIPTEVRNRNRAASNLVRPTVRLDLGLNLLVLEFPPQALIQYRIELRTSRRLRGVIYPEMIVGRDVAFEDEYAGSWCDKITQDEGPWKAAGWLPHARDWALFGEDGALICHKRSAVAVDPGRYYLVVGRSFDLPKETADKASNLGLLETGSYDSEGSFDILSLELKRDAGPLVPGLVLSGKRDVPVPLIRPVGGAEWSSYASVDVVWTEGTPRTVEFEGWSDRAADRFLVLAHANGVPQPLKLPTEGDGGKAAIGLAQFEIPCVGEIWLEEKGRPASGQKGRSRPLSLAVWPRTVVQKADGLRPMSDRPVVVIRCNDSSVHFDTQDADSLGNGLFSVHPGRARLDGVLIHDKTGIRLGLSMPIHRARFRLQGDAAGVMVLTPARLKELQELFVERRMGECALELSALPDSRFSLVLQDLATGQQETLMTGTTGRSGWQRVYVNEFLDALRSSGIAWGRFSIRCEDGDIPTDAWFIQPDAITSQAIADLAEADLPPSLRVPVQILVGEDPDWSFTEAVPGDLARRLGVWALAFEALDGQEPPRRFANAVDAELRGKLKEIGRFVRTAKELKEEPKSIGVAKELLKLWVKENPLETLGALGIALGRWVKRLEDLKQKLDSLARVGAWIEKLKRAIKGKQKQEDDVPDILVVAGKQYCFGEKRGNDNKYIWNAAMTLGRAVGELRESPLWSECAQLLRAMALLHCGQVSLGIRLLEACEYLQHLGSQTSDLHCLRTLVRSGGHDGVLTADHRILAEMSPREDDSLLSLGLAGDDDAWGSLAECSWLGAWLTWRWSVLSGRPKPDQTHFLEQTRGWADVVPATKDRAKILKEIKNGRPERWK